MANILNSKIVLRLNANWMRIGWATPAEAFVAMSGEAIDGAPPAKALNIEYELDKDGKPNYEKYTYMKECDLEEWMKLPIREYDMSISTSKLKLRVPTVLVCPRYYDMPKKELRPTKTAIRSRDGNRCVYSGVVLTNKTVSIDHVLPKSRGGKDTWENLVACHKEINNKKGNKLNEEVGLKLLKKPVRPRAIPICELIKDNKHPDHSFFKI